MCGCILRLIGRVVADLAVSAIVLIILAAAVILLANNAIRK